METDYQKMVEELGRKIINISTKNTTILNHFEIDLNADDKK